MGKHWPDGAKVTVKLNGQELPALVLSSGRSCTGNYDLVKLRVAEWDELNNQWLIGVRKQPVQSHKLKVRGTFVEGLDDE